MPAYLASQIISGKLQYKPVVTLYPQFQEELNKILIERGHSYLIEE